MESAGSDFHGVYGEDNLDELFGGEKFDVMMKRWEEFYRIPGKYWGIDDGKIYPIPAMDEYDQEIIWKESEDE
jgi:hypothetical protein